MNEGRIAVAVVAFLGLTRTTHAQQGETYHWGRVTYVQGTAAAIDAGSADGVRQWTRVEVVHRGAPVALLTVSSLGAHQARCDVSARGVIVTVGDSVRFIASGAPGPRAAVQAAPPVAVVPSVSPTPQAPQAPRPPAVRRDSSLPVRPPATAAPKVLRDTSASPLPAVPKAPDSPVRLARVTFLTTASVYINAGSDEGLVEGGRVDVMRGGASVAELKVVFVSTHQSSCQVVSKVVSLAVGDSVRFTPAAAAPDSAGKVAASRPTTGAYQTPGWSRRSAYGRLRGRIGLYYLTVQQQDSFGGRFSQPSGEIRLTGAGLGGTPIGLVADLRSRRLVQALPGSPSSTADQTRVYQALLFWQAPRSPLRVTTGRQYAPGITSVGLLDGASAELGLPAWDYGVFAGTQPDLISFAFSNDITELGGYVRRHSPVQSLAHWSVTAGVSGSYFLGHTNREFLYAQGNYLTRRLSIYAVQEVDYYRAWRRINGEGALAPTSTFANAQFQLTDVLSASAGVDNRRSVQLYRDVVNPATVFDDTFRRGVWAGMEARFAQHFQVAIDARTNHDVTTGTANTYTLSLGADRVTPLGVSLRSRSTRYTTLGRMGWLNAVTLGLEPFGRGSVQLTSGWRTERDTSAAPTLNVRWSSLDTDFSLGRSLFVILSAYRERGGIEAHDLVYAGVSIRF